MPGGKRKSYTTGGGAYKRKPYYSSNLGKRPSSYTTNMDKRKRSAARSIANARIGGFLGIENKFYDTSLVGSAIVSAATMAGLEKDPGTVNCISAPAQGDGESNRDGKSIKLLSVHVNGMVTAARQADQTAADGSSECFVALVLDTQTNGAQLNSEDVYTNPGADASLCSHPLRNLQYSKRFKILKYKIFTLQNPTMAWDGTNIEQSGIQRSFRMDTRLNLPVTFNATGAGVSSVVDNSLHIIAGTNGTQLVPLISYNARVRFVG